MRPSSTMILCCKNYTSTLEMYFNLYDRNNNTTTTNNSNESLNATSKMSFVMNYNIIEDGIFIRTTWICS